jgi:hypothetical protein
MCYAWLMIEEKRDGEERSLWFVVVLNFNFVLTVINVGVRVNNGIDDPIGMGWIWCLLESDCWWWGGGG